MKRLVDLMQERAPLLHHLVPLAGRIWAGRCPHCGARFEAPLCPSCRSASGIGHGPMITRLGPRELRFVGAWRAESDQARQLSPLGLTLRRFKDHGDRYAGRCLATLFATHCAPPIAKFDVVVAMPADAARLRMRGLSPAAWLARALARKSGRRVAMSALVREETRRPQRNLSGAERRSNVRGAFRLGADSVNGYAVMLVDDVVTTGATLREAARCLERAGAANVACAVLVCADDQVLSSCRAKIANAGTTATANEPR